MDTLDTMSSPDQKLSNEQPSENISDSSKPKKHRRSRHDPEPDWSAVMREKISKSQRRVGQACDRCKLKKMKCTPDTNGCACCRVLNLPCRVTDRVTGETFVRGAAGKMILLIDNLNKRNGDLKRANELLKQQNAEKERTHHDLEAQLYSLRSQYLEVRDELEQERRKNNPFRVQLAYEDDLDTTGLPQQDGVL